MTDGTQTREPATARPADPAVERYLRRLKPWRIAYVAGIVVAALVLLVIVKVAYSVGEISHVTLRTVATPPDNVPPAPAAATQTEAWSTDDATALGFPYYRGTVVTFDDHTVRGRDAQTGMQTWSYTRTDRTVCAALQTDGVTVAVYEVNGNCDELTGLATDTGERRWTRTLDKDSNHVDHAVNGHPNYVVDDFTVMIWTSTVIYAINPAGNQDTGNKNGGLDRWVFAQQGCTIHDAVLGSAGALISQTCSGRDCTDLKYCGNGDQLLLRDANLGENNDSGTNNGNPDQLKWNLVGSELVPVSSSDVVSARTADGTELDVLSRDKGKVQDRLALSGGTGDAVTVPVSGAVLIHFGGITYALREGAAQFAWQADTAGTPTAVSQLSTDVPQLSAARVTVPATDGIASLDPSDGSVQRTFDVPAPAGASTVWPYGDGFLVAGDRTVRYR